MACPSETEQPAGYFSTFAVGDSANYPGRGRSQKRNRKIFVCMSCHKRKLKCDKNLPCDRCEAAGTPHSCSYQVRPESTSGRGDAPVSPPASDEQSPPESHEAQRPALGRAFYRPSDRRCRVSGTTHWAEIASEFEEACPYLFGTDSRWETRYRQLKGLKNLFPSLSGPNFPFGHQGFLAKSRAQILEVFPPRPVVETLVDNYMSTYESTYRLFHPQQLRDELDAFYQSCDDVPDGWFAQLCMILAFGCQTASNDVFERTMYYAECWTIFFLDAAELLFGLSPYMVSPDLTAVRTLCLMVLARQADTFKGSDTAQLATVMGVLRNLALSAQLHRTTKIFEGMPEFEAEMRRRLWVTVRLLDVDVAMRCGTAFLCTEYDADAPLNINDGDLVRGDDGGWLLDNKPSKAHQYTDGTFQVKLTELLPLLEKIITTVNSPFRPALDYDVVLLLDDELRKRLRDTQLTFASAPPDDNVACAQKAKVQSQMLQVLIHRTLLALHHTPSRSSSEASPQEMSRGFVVESAMALLDVHHQWAAAISSPQSSIHTNIGSSRAGGWLVDVSHDDFGAAVMYILNAVRRRELDGGASCHRDIASGGAYLLARRSAEIMAATACRSVAHHKEFVGISILLACLEGIMAKEADMYPRMLALADWVEANVMSEGKIWAGHMPS
ncbi:Oleate activated transcription factor 3 [Pleurostoma richardsiae]|uniref:Oleate activated transcription factor 3 n=1 Tax=Pleurostoma richardsiae TaxID=41990 RepID=A0AA38REL4_9PEZI|nr:Oleate activated transcription factor 3 [Pleurostoma richardsiae]